MERRVAVLGAGVAGLATAFHLNRAGALVTVLEASDRVGGQIRTVRERGWLAESGPNSIQDTPEVARLVSELALTSERVAASPAAKRRYIVRRGRLVALPTSPLAFLASRLFSPWGKVRILGELRRKPGPQPEDQTFAAFIRGHFGSEALRRVAQPFASGVYAGDPERLSTRAAFPRLWALEQRFGSLLRAQQRLARERRAAGDPTFPALISFAGGLQRLTEALEQALPAGSVTLRRAVDCLRWSGTEWTVEGRDGAGFPWRERFDEVVSALPAHALARLRLAPGDDQPFSFLGAIDHPPVASLFAGFRTEAVRHPLDGFGCLAPASEKLPLLGILFSSTLFPGRAPPGHAAITVLFGGALQPDCARAEPELLWQASAPAVRRLLGIRGDPIQLAATCWHEAIPQYDLGHRARMQRLEAVERSLPRFRVTGAFRHGVSVPDALAAARALTLAKA